MTLEAVEAFLRDVRDNRAFAAQVRSDASVLNGYDLGAEEKLVLRRHDRDTLLAWGIAPDLVEALDVLPLADPAGD